MLSQGFWGAKRPLVVGWITLSRRWSEILALIRVETKDLLYIQALLNGTWQKGGGPAFPLHINDWGSAMKQNYSFFLRYATSPQKLLSLLPG